MFQSIEFDKACGELDNPDTSGYEFFTESQGVQIYRQYNQTSGLYQYKVYGVLDDVLPEICSQVYMDLIYRKKWDGYVKDLYEASEGAERAIYWRVAYPFPMSHRDYVYSREMKELERGDKKYWVVLSKSTPLKTVPPVKGVIRVTDYIQSCALTSDGKQGSRAYMHYYDNPGGSIPTWLINWAAKSGVPGFLKDMQKACHAYPDWKEKQAAKS